MSRQVAANPDQDMPALASTGLYPELAYRGLEHLAGMESRVLAGAARASVS